MTRSNEPAYAPILEDQYDPFAEPSPCDECATFDVCAAQLKACRVFFNWVKSGVLVCQPEEGYPNKKYYNLLFPTRNEDDDTDS